jgi:hypothetical protein
MLALKKVNLAERPLDGRHDEPMLVVTAKIPYASRPPPQRGQ